MSRREMAALGRAAADDSWLRGIVPDAVAREANREFNKILLEKDPAKAAAMERALVGQLAAAAWAERARRAS